MTRVVVDENLSPRLAERLRSEGHDAVHVKDVGLGSTHDEVILAWAARQGRAVITRDQDFIDHLRDLGAVRPSVVKVVQRGAEGLPGTAAVAARLTHVLPELDRRLARGEVITLNRSASHGHALPLERAAERGRGREVAAVVERARSRRLAPPQQGRVR